jgi:hypothetical protein
MKAKRTKQFPIFNMTKADECPVCLSVLMSFDGRHVICAACAGRMIEELRLALRTAQICNSTGSGFMQFSPFDNIISDLLRGEFPNEKRKGTK